MRSLRRYRDETALPGVGVEWGREVLGGGAPGVAGPGGGGGGWEAPPTLERWDLVESRWSLGSVVVVLVGAALAVLGVVAVTRTGLDDSWYRPVVAVAGVRHTPLLAVVEAGVGVVLVGAGLAGARGAAALVCISGAMAAGVAAVEPGLVAGELALQRWWAVTLAAGGAGLAVVAMVPWPHFVERHYSRAAATGPAAAGGAGGGPHVGAARPVGGP
jgi:hypothetical protein